MNIPTEIVQIDNITNDIEKIINSNILYRFTKELEFSYDDERRNDIAKIIKNLSKNENSYDSKTIGKNKLNDFLDKITNNKFKQTWTRLNYDQKFTKLEEYIDDYLIKNKLKINKKQLLAKIKDLLNKSKLVSSKDVIYDREQCKIISIKDFESILKNI